MKLELPILLLEDFILQQREALSESNKNFREWKGKKFANQKQEELHIRASNNLTDAIHEAEKAIEILKAPKVIFNKSEIQSNYNRIRYAEGLICQLPKTHEGRNTWILNYGVSQDAKMSRLRKELRFDEETQSCETVS